MYNNSDQPASIDKTIRTMTGRFIIAAMAVLLAMPAQAQEHSEGWARRFAHDFVEGMIGSDYYEVYNEDGQIERYDSQNFDYSYNVNKTYHHYGSGHAPEFYMGINLLCDNQSLALTSGMPQKAGKGFEFGFSLGQWGYYLTKNINLNTSVYLSRSRYWIGNGQYLNYTTDATGVTALRLTSDPVGGKEVKQGYIRYWSLRIPLCLEICSSSKKGPFVAVGPELEYRFGDVSKVKYVGGGKEKLVKGIDVNPLALNAVARVGINDFGIQARYSFTSLFSQNSPVETYPFSIAISTSF